MLRNQKMGKAALKANLEALGIRHFDQDIRTMSRADLFGYFASDRSERVLVAKLIKNIIWQAYEKIQAGTEPPITGNIRTFWYLWVKPVLGLNPTTLSPAAK